MTYLHLPIPLGQQIAFVERELGPKELGAGALALRSADEQRTLRAILETLREVERTTLTE